MGWTHWEITSLCLLIQRSKVQYGQCIVWKKKPFHLIEWWQTFPPESTTAQATYKNPHKTFSNYDFEWGGHVTNNLLASITNIDCAHDVGSHHASSKIDSGKLTLHSISTIQPSPPLVQSAVSVLRLTTMSCTVSPNHLAPTVVRSWHSTQVITSHPQHDLWRPWGWHKIIAGGQPGPAMATSPSLRQRSHWSRYICNWHNTGIHRMITFIVLTSWPTLGAAMSTYMQHRALDNTFNPTQCTMTIIQSIHKDTYSLSIPCNNPVVWATSQPPGLHTVCPSGHQSWKHTIISPPFPSTNCHSHLAFLFLYS